MDDTFFVYCCVLFTFCLKIIKYIKRVLEIMKIILDVKLLISHYPSKVAAATAANLIKTL